MAEELMQLPEKFTKEVVKSAFSAELIRFNYQKLLQDAENIVFTRENINEQHGTFKVIRDVLKQLDESKEIKKRPHIDAGKAIQDAFNELANPLKDVLDRKLAEFKKVNDQIKEENDKLLKEKQRQEQIQASINNFINQTTALIANATDDTQIVRIQKAIGSEKARTGYYGEFLEQLKLACDNLSPLINQRKEHIRELSKMKEEQERALQSGDIQKATDLMQEMEYKNLEIDENVIRIQEKAFQQVLNTAEIIVGEPIAEVVAPRRKSWKFKVDDIQLLYKKMPHLVELTPIDSKIKELMATKKAEGALDNVEELKIFGITFYLEKTY